MHKLVQAEVAYEEQAPAQANHFPGKLPEVQQGNRRRVEVMQKCIWCKQEITEYSSDPRVAAYERKWSIHWECVRNKVEDILDRSVPGGQMGSAIPYGVQRRAENV